MKRSVVIAILSAATLALSGCGSKRQHPHTGRYTWVGYYHAEGAAGFEGEPIAFDTVTGQVCLADDTKTAGYVVIGSSNVPINRCEDIK